MRTANHLKLSALSLAFLSVYTSQAQANAGVAQFSTGHVSLQRSTGTVPLASGGMIVDGDLITTGNNGRAQLRFTDGGMVSLQPDSQFKITRYNDAGDAKQDSFLVDLVRGGMRALTGLIGKRNKENYKVKTATATIGIRGSGFSLAYKPDGTLNVSTEQDAIEVCTLAGCVGLNFGESASVTDQNSLPKRTLERAFWTSPEPRRLISARNDDVDNTGAALHVPRQASSNPPPPPPPPSPGLTLALTSAGLGEGSADGPRLYLNGNATFSESNLVSYAALDGNPQTASGGTVDILATKGSAATNDLLLLGTWQNVVWDNGQIQTQLATSAFVTGQITPVPNAGLASLFPNAATYNLQAGTPVFSASSPSGVLNSGQITVNFNNSVAPINVNLNVSFGSGSNVNSPIAYQINGSGAPNGAGFQIPLNAIGGSCTTGSCSGYGSGFFSGPNAERAGLSFRVDTSANGTGQIGGAGIFLR